MIGEDSKPQEISQEIIEELQDDEDIDLESFGAQITDDLLEAPEPTSTKEKAKVVDDSGHISELLAQIILSSKVKKRTANISGYLRILITFASAQSEKRKKKKLNLALKF
jgi:hypothetical protein